jgi:hypothetical protein
MQFVASLHVGLGAGLAATLCPDQTFTGKNLYASLAHSAFIGGCGPNPAVLSISENLRNQRMDNIFIGP